MLEKIIKAITLRLKSETGRDLVAIPPQDTPALVIQNVQTELANETKDDTFTLIGEIEITDAQKFKTETEYNSTYIKAQQIIDSLHEKDTELNALVTDLKVDYFSFVRSRQTLESFGEDGGEDNYSLYNMTFQFKVF